MPNSLELAIAARCVLEHESWLALGIRPAIVLHLQGLHGTRIVHVRVMATHGPNATCRRSALWAHPIAFLALVLMEQHRGTRMRRGKKVLLGVVGGVLAVLVIAIGCLAVLNRPLDRAQVDAMIEQRLAKAVETHAGLSSALLTVYSEPHDRLMQYAVGVTHPTSTAPASIDSRFHSASVGKTMLATVYGQLVDEDRISFDDLIADVVDAELLRDLFVVDGIDHSAHVTIRHLLAHTSGVADYFAGSVLRGRTMLEEISADPGRHWNPRELLAFTQERQQALTVPGVGFAYSDTGYVLLGFALEAITGMPYEQVLQDRLFTPLGMHDSALMTRFGAGSGILAVDLDGVDLSERQALSVDWAGGGVVTTMDDLLRFSRALHGGQLLQAATYTELTSFASELEPGVRYGMGMMQFRFSQLSPLLFNMTDVHGAVGATGTFALYDPETQTHYIVNFGSLGSVDQSVEQLVQLRLLIDRLRG